MKICCICDSRSTNKHLFRFPKDLRDCWIFFARRFNRKFIHKDNSAICENHFTSDCLIRKKKGRTYLAPGSVPTIFLRENKNRVERIEVRLNKFYLAFAN